MIMAKRKKESRSNSDLVEQAGAAMLNCKALTKKVREAASAKDFEQLEKIAKAVSAAVKAVE
jgi:hypothetical protein